MTTNPIPEPSDELVLLPCPFCGAELSKFPTVNGKAFWMRHPENGCEATRRWVVSPEAIAAWNTRAAIAAMPELTVQGWQGIETFAEPTAPSSGNGVLVVDADGAIGEAYFRNFGDDDDGWWWANTTWGDYPEPERPNNPTHWMPLPSPPVESSNG